MDKKLIAGEPFWMFHPERREHEEGYTLFRKTVSGRKMDRPYAPLGANAERGMHHIP